MIKQESILSKEGSGIIEKETKRYKTFCNLVLKIKFEKLPPDHPALKINEKLLWDQAIKQNIEPSNWKDFIFKEMNAPQSQSSYYYTKTKSKIKGRVKKQWTQK